MYRVLIAAWFSRCVSLCRHLVVFSRFSVAPRYGVVWLCLVVSPRFFVAPHCTVIKAQPALRHDKTTKQPGIAEVTCLHFFMIKSFDVFGACSEIFEFLECSSVTNILFLFY